MIFCVEDDANIRKLVIYTLQSTGFEAKGFEEGKSFFEAVSKEIPELIILDIMLPGMDGMEILNRLKQNSRTKDITVIMATAKGAEYDKVQGLDAGADDYVTKPFGMLELVSRVKAVLRRTQKHADVSKNMIATFTAEKVYEDGEWLIVDGLCLLISLFIINLFTINHLSFTVISPVPHVSPHAYSFQTVPSVSVLSA